MISSFPTITRFPRAIGQGKNGPQEVSGDFHAKRNNRPEDHPPVHYAPLPPIFIIFHAPAPALAAAAAETALVHHGIQP